MAKSSSAKKASASKKTVSKLKVKSASKTKTSPKKGKAKAKPAAKTTVKIRKAPAKVVKAQSVKKPVAAKTFAAPKIVAPVAKPVAVKPVVTEVKAESQPSGSFRVGDYLVYPTHGVGLVTAIEKTEIAGTSITLYVLNFEKEKMTLRVPVNRAAIVGLRRLSSNDQIIKALSVLKGKPKTARGMWSRRATEYGQKINSGNIEAIAQVVRDLHKNVDDPDRSYSERVIYESAFDRLCGEYAAVNKIDAKQAQEILVKALNKKAA